MLTLEIEAEHAEPLVIAYLKDSYYLCKDFHDEAVMEAIDVVLEYLLAYSDYVEWRNVPLKEEV